MRDYKKVVRSTILKTCLNDKARAFDLIHNPSLVPPPANSLALEMGTLVHLLLLEPEKFLDKVKCAEYTRKGDKRHQEAVNRHPQGTIIIKEELLDQVRYATKKSFASQKVRDLLHDKNNLFEEEVIATFEGMQLMAQPDIYNLQTQTMIEIKTTSQRIHNSQDWVYICEKLKYFCQLAHYKKTLELFGYAVKEVIMFVQEVKYPYLYKIFYVPGVFLEQGLLQWETAIDIYKELLVSDHFTERNEIALESQRKEVDIDIDVSEFYI